MGYVDVDEVLQAANRLIEIPMVASGDSLNVATAAAILCHQLSPLKERNDT